MTNKLALIIENRFDVTKVIEQHKKFLPEDWIVMHVKAFINTVQDYNELLVSRDFWEHLPAEHVLIFQADSGLLKEGIEGFLEWPFIGAPIKHMPGYMNGGLSLRQRSAMLDVIDNVMYRGENEDCYFVAGLRQLGYVLPAKEVAEMFSVETELVFGSCGYHQIESWLTEHECYLIRHQYD